MPKTEVNSQETWKGFDNLVNLIPKDWYEVLMKDFQQDYAVELSQFIESERYRCIHEHGKDIIYPAHESMFKALELTPFDKVKAVILAQDPYHNPGQAMGLALSVPEGVKFPPSLRNVFKEYSAQLNKPVPKSGDLSRWAEEGVLLLNTTLTVEESKPLSHSGKGWERLTDAMIRCINEKEDKVLFLLWGAHAQSKEPLIDSEKHLILKSAHPSPLSASRGFFGNGHFVELRKHLTNVS